MVWSLCLVQSYIWLRIWCFFFFKQKTAYEMRISDWSSDVCSSDLHRAGHHQVGDQRLADIERRKRGFDLHRGVGQPADGARIAALLHLQIGRASCRERVCQYV